MNNTHWRICLRVEIFLTCCQQEVSNDRFARFLIEFGMSLEEVSSHH